MTLNAYLHFPGTCREAFAFYEKVLRGRIELTMTYGEAPGPNPHPAELNDWIIHTRLVCGDQVLMGSDAPPAMQEEMKGCTISIGVDTPAEAERIYGELSAGGTIRMPLAETFWAQRFGMFVDRFGVPWMVNCEKPR